MPRIQPKTIETAPEGAKPVLENIQQKMGQIPNVLGTLANSPAAVHAYVNLKDALSKGSLGDKVGESLAIAIARKSECGYCSSAHFAIADMVGVDEDERRQTLQGKSNDPKVQALIDFAYAIIDKRGFVDDSDISALRDAGHGDDAILEVLTVVTLNLFTNYANHIAETTVDFPEIKTESATA